MYRPPRTDGRQLRPAAVVLPTELLTSGVLARFTQRMRTYRHPTRLEIIDHRVDDHSRELVRDGGVGAGAARDADHARVRRKTQGDVSAVGAEIRLHSAHGDPQVVDVL